MPYIRCVQRDRSFDLVNQDVKPGNALQTLQEMKAALRVFPEDRDLRVKVDDAARVVWDGFAEKMRNMSQLRYIIYSIGRALGLSQDWKEVERTLHSILRQTRDVVFFPELINPRDVDAIIQDCRERALRDLRDSSDQILKTLTELIESAPDIHTQAQVQELIREQPADSFTIEPNRLAWIYSHNLPEFRCYKEAFKYAQGCLLDRDLPSKPFHRWNLERMGGLENSIFRATSTRFPGCFREQENFVRMLHSLSVQKKIQIEAERARRSFETDLLAACRAGGAGQFVAFATRYNREIQEMKRSLCEVIDSKYHATMDEHIEMNLCSKPWSTELKSAIENRVAIAATQQEVAALCYLHDVVGNQYGVITETQRALQEACLWFVSHPSSGEPNEIRDEKIKKILYGSWGDRSLQPFVNGLIKTEIAHAKNRAFAEVDRQFLEACRTPESSRFVDYWDRYQSCERRLRDELDRRFGFKIVPEALIMERLRVGPFWSAEVKSAIRQSVDNCRPTEIGVQELAARCHLFTVLFRNELTAGEAFLWDTCRIPELCKTLGKGSQPSEESRKLLQAAVEAMKRAPGLHPNSIFLWWLWDMLPRGAAGASAGKPAAGGAGSGAAAAPAKPLLTDEERAIQAIRDISTATSWPAAKKMWKLLKMGGALAEETSMPEDWQLLDPSAELKAKMKKAYRGLMRTVHTDKGISVGSSKDELCKALTSLNGDVF